MHHNLSCIFTWFVACWHNLSWNKRAQICHHTTAVEGIHNLGTYGLWSMKDPYDKGLGIQGHIRSFWLFNHVYRQARVMRTYLILRDKVFSKQFFDTKKYCLKVRICKSYRNCSPYFPCLFVQLIHIFLCLLWYHNSFSSKIEYGFQLFVIPVQNNIFLLTCHLWFLKRMNLWYSILWMTTNLKRG